MYEDKDEKILKQEREEKKVFNNNYKKPRIKTYRDFAVKALNGKPTSLAQMIIQEKKKKENQKKYSIKNKNNILILILSIVLVILGVIAVIAIVFFAINKKEEVSVKNQTINPNSLIFFDYKTESSIEGLNYDDVLSVAKKNMLNSNIPIGDIKIFYFTKKDEDGYKILANAEDFFDVLDTRASYQFKRNLKGYVTTGILSTLANGKEVFMILEMMDYDSSYSHILS